jgi:hypothetical protein
MASTNTTLKELFEQRAKEIEEIATGITDEQANRRPAEGEWCARDVLTHLLGSEARSFEDGLRLFLEKDSVVDITPGDPYLTEARKKMRAQELSAGVAKQVRQIAQFIGGLTPEQLQETANVPFLKNYGMSEYPTLETWAGLMANMHLKQHVDQLRELCK